VRLVVTCDCGVGNRVEVQAARELGMDVVVTDHHIPPAELPDAVAVVDPHRSDCSYPNPDLTGAGLAFRLATALLARRGVATRDLAALAAIGTIADLAPMTGECRAIVRMGLAELGVTKHPGLRGLVQRSAEDPDQPTARDVGFGIVPRLNAAGRIAEAELALDLLVEEDPVAAEARLTELEQVHLRRREMTTAAIDAGRRLAAAAGDSGNVPLALRHDDWPPGLLGLVAGRLADELARPVAVATLLDSELRGSVRSTPDFHVSLGLDACAVHLTKRGGHAAAGGFSALPQAWDAFAAAFAALPRPYPPDGRELVARPGQMNVDLVLTARHVGWPLFQELAQLAPFGPGHVQPLLAVTGLTVATARRVGAGEDHLSFRLRRGLETVDAIAFGVASERDTPAEGTAIDVVGYLEARSVEGEPRLQIRVLDYATADASPLAARRLPARTPEPLAALG
jgi:single-stranded-DNA-specific exonuclease